MKGRSAIRGCRKLGLKKTGKQKTKETGLLSLPDDVALTCLARVSRFDLAALAVASKAHRSLVTSPELYRMRDEIGIEPSFYVCLHISPEPTPRWFILHPVQHRLKSIYPHEYVSPESSASYVVMGWGILIIGGLVNGKPTRDVAFFDCCGHGWYHRGFPSLKVARASASARLIGEKLYVFGGIGGDDVADSSNWAEVYNPETRSWELLSAVTPKMPFSIKQSALVMDQTNAFHVLDQDGESFSFTPSRPLFVASGKTDSKPGFRDDWCIIAGNVMFCRGDRGRILWCLPEELDWQEVKGLEELQQDSCDITKLCRNSANIVIFWNAQPLASESLELWSAEISLEYWRAGVREIWGKIERSGSLLKLDPLTDSSTIKVCKHTGNECEVDSYVWIRKSFRPSQALVGSAVQAIRGVFDDRRNLKPEPALVAQSVLVSVRRIEALELGIAVKAFGGRRRVLTGGISRRICSCSACRNR
ncbi:unnamed protein product [Microthlaspi erraticum]|uniref:F-box domain-containing protein n=1 Tax=Microthlaspi erraticum TaxID=1685480 RepID=A0A6D2K1C0_9BRAS|nr:unnamed protein product [Microthlaspi erraticum]